MNMITDFLDRTICVGDTIAAAFRAGNMAEMRAGEVLEIYITDSYIRRNGQKGYRGRMKVKWISDSWSTTNKISTIDIDKRRFLRLERYNGSV